MVKGMGGAMDLVAGVKRVVVITDHVTKAGEPKLIERCTLPLTGKACVDLIITDLAVIACDKPGFRLIALAPGIGVEEVRAKTGARLTIEEALAA